GQGVLRLLRQGPGNRQKLPDGPFTRRLSDGAQGRTDCPAAGRGQRRGRNRGTGQVGELRDRFWELPLAELGRAEWEALCDGCGHCCLHKLEDEDTGEIAGTNVACKLLDTATARCSDYRHRKAYVPDCLRLTLKLV